MHLLQKKIRDSSVPTRNITFAVVIINNSNTAGKKRTPKLNEASTVNTKVTAGIVAKAGIKICFTI